MWNREYFVNIYAESSIRHERNLISISNGNSLFNNAYTECSANILIPLAIFAKNLLIEIETRSTAWHTLDNKIDNFIDFLSDKDITISSHRGVRSRYIKDFITKGLPVYSRGFYSDFASYYPNRGSHNTSVNLTIKRTELKRILYQFLLSEDLDYQGFTVYLNYDKTSARKNYTAVAAYKLHVKDYIDKDIPVKHMDSLKNITFKKSISELEIIAEDLKLILI